MDRRSERKMGNVSAGGLILLAVLGSCSVSSVPGWVSWNARTEPLPDNPGLLEGTLELDHRQLKYVCSDAVWKTDSAWMVSDFMTDDIDHDGWPEVLMNVWVKGQYGDYHPIWEKPQESEYTQRLFVFDISSDRLEPQWMSSEMKPQYKAWSVKDHQLYLTDLNDRVSEWIWEGRGFVRTDS